MTHSLTTLEALHADLENLFQAHREALVAGDVQRAVQLLSQYRSTLMRHIADERDLILPLLAERNLETPGNRREMYDAEHVRIDELLTAISARVAGLTDPEPRQILEILDRETTFKHLMEHHHLREHNMLYPILDSVLEPALIANILSRCARAADAKVA